MLSKSQQNQKGISLIEILIGMLIGLFIMGGVSGIYVTSLQTSRVNNSLRTMQENGRYALIMLKKTIEKAGYVADFDPGNNLNPFPAAGNNEITVRFESDIDCTGASTLALPAPDTGIAENKFKVSDGDLQCIGNAAGVGSPLTIIEGVDQIRILYGLDVDGNSYADQYVRAEDVGAGNWQNSVTSINIVLLLNSIDSVKTADETKSYELLDVNSGDITDRKIHKVFTTTLLIRNRMKLL